MPTMAGPLRPDPDRGVFETLLVVDGQPIEPEAHLARLTASLEALFGAKLPTDAPGLLLSRADGIGCGRLRLTVAPGSEGILTTEVSTAEVAPALLFPQREFGVALRSFELEGGLGGHKWADRSLLKSVEAIGPGETIPLLVDTDGSVLEASRANIFAIRDGELTTPLADGRILPGVAREGTIEVARTAGIPLHEEDLTRADLLEADEVFITGSIRGVEPVRSIDGTDLRPTGELSSQIVAGLRRRWLGGGEPATASAPATARQPGRPVH
jgi:para-aminobenzoate synthetase/4-amino-4-deoxychorismate lyase